MIRCPMCGHEYCSNEKPQTKVVQQLAAAKAEIERLRKILATAVYQDSGVRLEGGA